jgi:dimethylargininase
LTVIAQVANKTNIAITRQVSSRFAECEITHIKRTSIDLEIARSQHHSYIQTLRSLGCEVIELPAQVDLPDSVFVEDTAVILPELALITIPGASSRRPETESIAEILGSFRKLAYLQPTATLDGGDVLVVGRKIYVGLSTRSNQAAIDQLNNLLSDFGYHTQGVEIHGCLHLKSAVTRVTDKTLLINHNWVDPAAFKGFELIEIDPLEPFAANCLPIGDFIILPAAFPKTRQKMEERGYKIMTVDVTELAKAEGAVTCCSLIFDRS